MIAFHQPIYVFHFFQCNSGAKFRIFLIAVLLGCWSKGACFITKNGPLYVLYQPWNLRQKFLNFMCPIVYFHVMQIALWHKLDSSSKKEFTKIMQKEWKVNKLCCLFPENTCTNNISSTEIDTWFDFFLGFWPKTSKFTRRRGGTGTNNTLLKS